MRRLFFLILFPILLWSQSSIPPLSSRRVNTDTVAARLSGHVISKDSLFLLVPLDTTYSLGQSRSVSLNTFLVITKSGKTYFLNIDTTKYATSSMTGFLKYTDWATFNAKQSAIGNLADTSKYVKRYDSTNVFYTPTQAKNNVLYSDSTVKYVTPTRSILTGNGLSGGGTLFANRTLTIDTSVTQTIAGANSKYPLKSSLGTEAYRDSNGVPTLTGNQTFTGTNIFSSTLKLNIPSNPVGKYTWLGNAGIFGGNEYGIYASSPSAPSIYAVAVYDADANTYYYGGTSGLLTISGTGSITTVANAIDTSSIYMSKIRAYNDSRFSLISHTQAISTITNLQDSLNNKWTKGNIIDQGSIGGSFGAINIGSNSLTAGSATINGIFRVSVSAPQSTLELYHSGADTNKKNIRLVSYQGQYVVGLLNDAGDTYTSQMRFDGNDGSLTLGSVLGTGTGSFFAGAGTFGGTLSTTGTGSNLNITGTGTSYILGGLHIGSTSAVSARNLQVDGTINGFTPRNGIAFDTTRLGNVAFVTDSTRVDMLDKTQTIKGIKTFNTGSSGSESRIIIDQTYNAGSPKYPFISFRFNGVETSNITDVNDHMAIGGYGNVINLYSNLTTLQQNTSIAGWVSSDSVSSGGGYFNRNINVDGINGNYFKGLTTLDSARVLGKLKFGGSVSSGITVTPGIMFWDSTQHTFYGDQYLVRRSFDMTHRVITADRIDSNSAAEVALDSANMAPDYPQVGKVVELVMMGVHTLSNPQTMIIRLRHNNPTTGTVLDSAIVTTAVTNKAIDINSVVTFRAIGVSGAIVGRVNVISNGVQFVSVRRGTVTVNTTGLNTLYTTAQMSNASTDKIVIRQGWVNTRN